MIDVLELIHSAGYIYNDLKLENLLLGFDSDVDHFHMTKEDIFKHHQVKIIDFGNATKYVDSSTLKHIEKHRVKMFKGNIEFASLNQIYFASTSRRDDFISLFYLLVYVFKKGKMPNLTINYDGNKNKEFKKILDVRSSEQSIDLCFDNTAGLVEFHSEVFSYRFKD